MSTPPAATLHLVQYLRTRCGDLEVAELHDGRAPSFLRVYVLYPYLVAWTFLSIHCNTL